MVDVSVAVRAARGGAAAAISDFGRRYLAWTLASTAMVFALISPALWNGFPLIFPDTGGYLERPILGTLEIGRSALYGLSLYAGIPLAFWPNAVAQAALTAWLFVLAMRTHGLGGRPWLALGIMVTLAIGTSLPWFVGQLMPDILFPAAVLAIHMLAFRCGQLARWERFALAAVVVVAIPCHMAAAGLCVAVVASLWLLSRISRIALPEPRLSFAAGAVIAGIALCPISNFAITGTFGFTPGGLSFLFGRLIEDGIVARYLDDRCPDPTLHLCAYKAELPEDADDWLWTDPTFDKLGGWAGYADEERRIIIDTLKLYPLTHAAAAVADTGEQFISFQTEVSVEDNGPTIETLLTRTPQLVRQFASARQQEKPFDVAPLNYLHVPFAGLAIAGLAVALLFRRRLNVAPELAALCLTILLALFANAAICGIFAHPVDRYQSRLVALAPFAMALLLGGRWRVCVPKGNGM